jgi:hypothetical protein
LLVWLAAGLAILLASASLVLVLRNGEALATALTTGAAILALSFSLVGAIVVARRPEQILGWLMLLGGAAGSLNAFAWEYARYALVTNPAPWPVATFSAWLSIWIFAPGFATIPLILLLFPTGKLPSRRWRWLPWLVGPALLLAAIPVALTTWPLRGPALVATRSPAGLVSPAVLAAQNAGIFLLLLALALAAVAALLRLRRATGVERQQLKWLAYAGVITALVMVTVSPAAPFPLPTDVAALLMPLALLALASIPAAIGIAILRYRLYQIDFLINRTLVYGSLTLLLSLVYFGSVIVLQSLLRGLTGERSPIAIVLSTLAIAALFQPLRRRLQAFIDRRFFRRKYDAAQVLAAFSRLARDEVELDRLGSALLAVVDETMQPEELSLSLWEPGG